MSSTLCTPGEPAKPHTIKIKKSDYSSLLQTIDRHIPKRDVEKLKFLCYDLVENKEYLENCKYAMDILIELGRVGEISNEKLSLLAELVHRIGHIALKKKHMLPYQIDWKPERDKSNLDKFRVLMFDISQEMRTEDLEALKDHVKLTSEDIFVDEFDEKKTCYEIFLYLEENGVIAEDDLDLLKHFCKDQVRSQKIIDILNKYESEADFPMMLKFPKEEVGEKMCLLTPDAIRSSFINGRFNFPSGTKYARVEDLQEAFASMSLEKEDIKRKLDGDFEKDDELDTCKNKGESENEKNHPKIRSKAGNTLETDTEMTNDSDDDDDDDSVYIKRTKMRISAYKMDSVPRGKCVIIANEKFIRKEGMKEPADRNGNQHDISLLLHLFDKKLKFEVDIHEDLTGDEIVEVLQRLSKEDHTKYDSFFCCIMSHGIQGAVLGVDCVAVKIQKIIGYFNSSNCPSLMNKPKVFIIQACQGNEWMTGSNVRSGDMKNPNQKPTGFGEGVEQVIPNDTDMFLLLSTLPGYKSVRTPSGTWFIKTLYNAIDHHHTDGDLGSIVVKINDLLSRLAPASAIDKETNLRVFQQVGPIYTLRKLLFFTWPPNSDVMEGHTSV